MMIASRELTLRTANGVLKIPIHIFAPEKEQTERGSADMKSAGRTKSPRCRLAASTSAQALVHALQIIGAEIYSSSYHKSGKLFWDEPGKGYGFPVVPTYRDLLVGDDAKYL